MDSRRTTLCTIATIAATIAILSGCTPRDVTSDSASASAPALSSAAPEATATAYDPSQSTDQNLAVFNSVNERTVASVGDPNGTDLAQALINSGFDQTQMETTVETTTAGETADAIFIAVKSNGSCFVGQYRHKASGEDGDNKYVGALFQPISTGKCLIGNSLPVE
ncbi:MULTISPECIES: DUF6993 domain-containing protein [unclassified Rathayibacter]|uniref:DUF6993 domain-containing protein n=1 Tax=unclassified Rathayibacter TaxID=2609250 RepID=UPI0011B0AEA1|nr:MULTISPECIES: hypothetical protein [unclassified Rathayibacter]